MPPLDRRSSREPKKRLVALTVLLMLVGSTVGIGQVAAHNPACHQPGHASGPHYEKGTASEKAFVHNPNLRSPDKPDSLHPDHANSIHNREGSCSAGHSD